MGNTPRRKDTPLTIRVLILVAESDAAARGAAEIGEASAAFAVSIRLAE